MKLSELKKLVDESIARSSGTDPEVVIRTSRGTPESCLVGIDSAKPNGSVFTVFPSEATVMLRGDSSIPGAGRKRLDELISIIGCDYIPTSHQPAWLDGFQEGVLYLLDGPRQG